MVTMLASRPRSVRAGALAVTGRSFGGLSWVAPPPTKLEALGRAVLADADERLALVACRRADLRRSRRDERFRALLEAADLLLPVGRLFSWRVGGPSATARDGAAALGAICAAAADAEAKLFVLGGRDAEPFEWASRAGYRYPGLLIAGAATFGVDARDAEGEARLVRRMADAGADVVLLVPQSEAELRFAAERRGDLPGRIVFVLLGGASGVLTTPAERRRSHGLPSRRTTRRSVHLLQDVH